MTIESQICSRCGAGLPKWNESCPYCGKDILSPQDKSASHESYPSTLSPLSRGYDNLSPELAMLKTPKPSQPHESSGCMLAFGLIWTLFSALFLIVGVVVYIRDSTTYNRLSSQGKSAVATITNLEIRSGDDSDSYYVHFQFQAPIKGDPVRFRGSDEVSSSSYSSFQVGQPIEIVYWVPDPSLSAIKAELRPVSIALHLCLGGIGVLFTLIGFVIVSSSIIGVVNTNRLRVSGRDTLATVFRKWTKTDSEGDTSYFVAYAFRAEIPGKDFTLISRAENNKYYYDHYQPGDSVPVRYMPSNPNICQLKTEQKR